MDITRRTLAGMLAAAAATNAQDSGEDLKAARDDLRDNARQIAAVKVPMATEPAFRFIA